MSAIISDPNTLTKDRLRKTLIEHDVTLPPPDARKQAYVDLYREHILSKQRSTSSLDFSTDEDEIPKAQSKSRKRKPGSPKKLIKTEVIMPAKEILPEVIQLTDDELAMELRDRGVDVGPIISTTRKVYQRKLHDLMTNRPPTEDEEEYEDDVDDSQDFSDHDEAPQPEPRSRPVPRSEDTYHTPAAKGITGRKSYRTAERQYDEPVHTSIRSRTSQRVETTSQSSAATKTSQPAKSRGWCSSVWLQLLILAIIAVLVYFVVQQMEPAVEPPRIKSKNTV